MRGQVGSGVPVVARRRHASPRVVDGPGPMACYLVAAQGDTGGTKSLECLFVGTSDGGSRAFSRLEVCQNGRSVANRYTYVALRSANLAGTAP